MSTLGKVLLVFVFLASLGFLYVVARTVKTHDVHRTLHKVYADALVEREDRILEVTGQKLEADPLATSVPEGILQVSRKLEVLLANQGRVWRDCVFAARDNTALTVQVDNPNPHGIGDKTVLYVFEQHPQPADFADGIYSNNRPLVYVGEFKVSAVNGNRVSLQATRRLTATQAQALANSPGPFALYEQLPIDLHAVWQDVKKHRAEKLARMFDGALVTPDVIKEFQRDGDPPIEGTDLDERILVELKFLKDYAQLTQQEQADVLALGFKTSVNLRSPAGDDVKDPQGKVVSVDISKVIQKDAIAYFMQGLPDGKDGPAKVLVAKNIAQEQRRMYVRPLRDYGLLFRQVLAELPGLENRIEDLKTNVAAKGDEKDKLDSDNKIQLALQKLLTEEKVRLEGERTAVRELNKELTDEIAQAREKVAKLAAENKRLAQLLKDAQLAEAQRINREAREKVSKQ